MKREKIKKELTGLKYEDKKIQIEKKTFKNWINMYLSTCEPQAGIDSLKELGDGHSLILLVERLLSKEFKRNVIIKHNENPKLEIQKKENINIALEELKKYGLRVTIAPWNFLPENYHKDLSMILGFLWSLILKFQLRVSGNKGKDSEKQMIEWINKSNEIHGNKCKRLDENRGLRNDDFKDGRVLAYLVNSKVPDTISEDTINNDPNLLEIALNAAKNTLGVPLIVSANAIQDDLCGARDLLTYFGVFRDKSSKVVIDNYSDLVSDTSEETSRDITNEALEKLREEMRLVKEQNERNKEGMEGMLRAMQEQLERERRMREEEERKRLLLEEENIKIGNQLIDKAGELKLVSKELSNEKKRVVNLEPIPKPKEEEPQKTYKLTMAPLPKLKYKMIQNKTPPVTELDPMSSLQSPDDELMRFYREQLKKYGPVRLHTYVEPTDWENGMHLSQIIHLIDPSAMNVDGLGNHSSRSLVMNALAEGKRILGDKYPAKLDPNDVVTGNVDPNLLRKYLKEMKKKIEDAQLIKWLNEHEKVNLPNKYKLNKLDYTSGEVLAHTISRIAEFDTKNMPKNAQELISDVLRCASEQLKIRHECDPTKVKRAEENKDNLRKLLNEMKRLHEISELQRWVNKKLEPFNRKVDDVLDAKEYYDGNKYANLVNAVDPRVIERDVSNLDNDTRIRKALNACKRDFKLLTELNPKDVALSLVDRKDQFEFLTELKNYDDLHRDDDKGDNRVNLGEALGPIERALDFIQPPPRIHLTEDPPRSKVTTGGRPNTGLGGDESMIEVVTILQTEKDHTKPVVIQPQADYPRRTKDQLVWEMQLRELYYRKGRRTNFKNLTEEHEDNKFLEQRYRNFKLDLNEIYNELNELLLSDKHGKPDQKLVKQYQSRLLKYKGQLKEAKGVWVKAENKLGTAYEPKTETEVYFEKMRLKLLRVIDYPEKYTENPQRMHVLQGKIAQLNKELYRDNELFETVKILRRNRRVARHNLEDLLEKKQKKLRLFYFKGENNRLYNLIDDLQSGVNAKEKRNRKADIIKFMIDNFNSIFKKIPVSYKEVSQLVTEPCKQIENRYLTKKDLYSKVNYKPTKVNEIVTYSNNGFKLQLENVKDPFLLASVVKHYFNQLGNSVLSTNFNEIEIENEHSIKHCRKLISELPIVRRSTAAFIFSHFYSLAQHGNKSKMTSSFLSQIFSPIFLP